MFQSRLLVVAAILFGLVLVAAALVMAPFNASARAAASPEGVAADRIGAAFASIEEARPDARIAAAAARASKGDFGGPGCRGAVWPNVDASCLKRADGRPLRSVRTVTVGHQDGENTTVLVRVPAPEMAER